MQDLDQFQQQHLYVQSKLNEADPIWGESAHVYSSPISGWIVLGDRCGSFICDLGLRQFIAHWPPDARARLTTWINEQNHNGDKFPRVDQDVLTTVFDRKQIRFSAQIDNFFRYLSNRRYRIGEFVIPPSALETAETLAAKQTIKRWTEISDDRQLWGFIKALTAAGILVNEGGNISLTADGMMRLDQMDAQGAASDQAFVAMWFGDDMNAAFEEGILPGLADAGYRAFRIDRKEHANKIDDEIIAEIRRSRFVVADFTCGTVTDGDIKIGIPRGGVYYEAGFAQGLSMPVIWTVRADQIDLVHFDTRQFNHITWNTPIELREKLYRRVAAVLGFYKAGDRGSGAGSSTRI